MFIVGSDDGLYRVPDVDGSPAGDAAKVLDSGRAMRLRRFDGLEGLFAATTTGLYRSTDGTRWEDLGVPRTKVYSVGVGPAGERLYAGTKPAHVYVVDVPEASETDFAALEWRELEGFQELPSREEWRLPRHENLAQVRDLLIDLSGSNRIVAGVEVGGVHVNDDGGETWEERSAGVHDDVHEHHVVGPAAYVAATGDGLYRTTDAGRTWERLDGGVRQTYFRRTVSIDGAIYASGALANSSTWDDDADPALFSVRDGGLLDPLEIPREDDTVTGMTAVDGALAVATHRGSLFVRREDGWDAGEFPVPGELTGRYTPVASFDDGGDPTGAA